jgi:DNA (cytosine-5)-methyltransferase 1
MLRERFGGLHQGAAMHLIVRSLEALGYSWAYRIVDSRFTGVPQRRLRVVILASRNQKPEQALLASDHGPPDEGVFRSDAYGFYWTEGRGGLGWAKDALPTLKGGSTIGINSAPAMWIPNAPAGSKLVIPSVGDGEKLQGFTPNWTEPAVAGRMNHRWKLVGNAVTVGVADWVGREIRDIEERAVNGEQQATPTGSWPNAGWGARENA